MNQNNHNNDGAGAGSETDDNARYLDARVKDVRGILSMHAAGSSISDIARSKRVAESYVVEVIAKGEAAMQEAIQRLYVAVAAAPSGQIEPMIPHQGARKAIARQMRFR